MKLKNASSVPVLLSIGCESKVIMPGETEEVAAGVDPVICLQHDYPSTAMSVEEIRRNETKDTSVIDILFANHYPPYFRIALDSTYQLTCPEDSTVVIQREKLRPCYVCAYDRFYPHVSEGNVRDICQSFREKVNFAKLYQQAICGGRSRTVLALVIVLSVVTVPFGFLLLLANSIAGIMVLALELLGLAAVYGIGNKIANVFSDADLKITLSNLDSDRIIKYYTEAKAKYPERISVD